MGDIKVGQVWINRVGEKVMITSTTQSLKYPFMDTKGLSYTECGKYVACETSFRDLLKLISYSNYSPIEDRSLPAGLIADEI